MTSVCVCVFVPTAGKTLVIVGEYEKRLGSAEREFLHTAAAGFLSPLRNFLEGDWKTIAVCLTHCLPGKGMVWVFESVANGLTDARSVPEAENLLENMAASDISLRH